MLASCVISIAEAFWEVKQGLSLNGGNHMTIEQIKAYAMERLGKDITDEQAQAWLVSHSVGAASCRPEVELTDEELDNVTGGCGGAETSDADRRRASTFINEKFTGRCPACNGPLKRWSQNCNAEVYASIPVLFDKVRLGPSDPVSPGSNEFECQNPSCQRLWYYVTP
jgi:hypothetical protein